MSLATRLALSFLERHPSESALALERLPLEEQAEIVGQAPEAAAAALRRMVGPAAAAILSRLAPADAAAVVDHAGHDAAVALLRRLPEPVTAAVLARLPAARQEPLLRALHFPEGTAGALMDPAVLALPDDLGVAEARLRLRRASRGLLYYVYVVDRAHRLVGVLDIPELMNARARTSLRAVIRHPVERLPAHVPAAAIRWHPGWRSFHAMPVVDEEDHLLGAIRYQTLRQLELDTAQEAAPASRTIAALGELFHLGMAGLVEGIGVVAASSTLRRVPAPVDRTARGEGRER